jgi:pimeloyl-ACP methyl ester carboxylesterase
MVEAPIPPPQIPQPVQRLKEQSPSTLVKPPPTAPIVSLEDVKRSQRELKRASQKTIEKHEKWRNPDGKISESSARTRQQLDLDGGRGGSSQILSNIMQSPSLRDLSGLKLLYPDKAKPVVTNRVLKSISQPGDTQILTLPDGRQLGWGQFGSNSKFARTWVPHHGTPGSRQVYRKWYHKYGEKHKIRLICLDRPGYGHTPLTKSWQTHLEFMKDIEYLLDYLGVDQFDTFGASGGGPCALATAYHFGKERVGKTGIMCGVGHPEFERPSLGAHKKNELLWQQWFPSLFKPFFGRRIEKYNKKLKGSEEFDRINHREETRYGVDGWYNDRRNNYNKGGWGFELEDIDANSIRWEHGGNDVNCSAFAARQTVDRIGKNAIINIDAGKDHGTLQEWYMEQLMDWLRKPL